MAGNGYTPVRNPTKDQADKFGDLKVRGART